MQIYIYIEILYRFQYIITLDGLEPSQDCIHGCSYFHAPFLQTWHRVRREPVRLRWSLAAFRRCDRLPARMFQPRTAGRGCWIGRKLLSRLARCRPCPSRLEAKSGIEAAQVGWLAGLPFVRTEKVGGFPKFAIRM